MTSDRPSGSKRGGRTRALRTAPPAMEQNADRTVIAVERSGEWMPVEELRDAALQAVAAGHDVTIDLDKLAYLDASALQILLALQAAQKKAGRRLELHNASPDLQQWFEFAGASNQFFPDGARRR